MFTDSEIISMFFERSEQAIDALSQKYGALCGKVAQNIFGNNGDAEECINDAYLAMWNSIPPAKPDPLLTYLCKVVRNISIKRYHANISHKRCNFYDAALDELAECIASQNLVENEFEVVRLRSLLNDFLAMQNKVNRVIFVRRYWYADSINQIAKIMNMTENNVSVKLLRIRNRLKSYLRKAGYEI